MQIIIPTLEPTTTEAILSRNAPFIGVDANIAAWLDEHIEATITTTLQYQQLTQAFNNKELVEFCGGENELASHIVTLGQIRNLAQRQLAGENLLLTDGYSNLFFVRAKKFIYIVGIVFEQAQHAFTPYIYRRQNLYRSWSRGNRLFTAVPTSDQL